MYYMDKYKCQVALMLLGQSLALLAADESELWTASASTPREKWLQE
jgi:hypothetical protein